MEEDLFEIIIKNEKRECKIIIAQNIICETGILDNKTDKIIDSKNLKTIK